MPEGLLVTVRFPRCAYSGGDFGAPEAIPSPARLHAAFVAAAAGGPGAQVDGRVLVAPARHAEAVKLLERELIGVFAPKAHVNRYTVSRFRLRAAVDHNEGTEFEPFSALSGPIVYVWPLVDAEVVATLGEIAQEITHVGRADSIALVDVEAASFDEDRPDLLRLTSGRGSGSALRIPSPGRFDLLVAEHRTTSKPGGHGAGSRGVQAVDQILPGVGERGTVLRRFASRHDFRWPYTEAWCIELPDAIDWYLAPERRVGTAARIHRALVASIADDVPQFVTGRDGDGPMRGPGHLAIHLTRRRLGEPPSLILGIPRGVPEADRARLLSALAARVPVRLGTRSLRLGEPTVRPADQFWDHQGRSMEAEVPIVLDTPGTPRNAPWTLDDAVVCSVGYALRAVLEQEGFEWGRGWEFRRALVQHLRDRGVAASARRVLDRASTYVHRARDGDLLVAVCAQVALGDLGTGVEFLALGRARHLGGGLMRPTEGGA